MANTIRIARSTTTNTPTTLAQGEVAYSETGSPNGEGELFIGTAGPAITKITTTVLTGTDGVVAQPNSSLQDNQVITTGLGIDGADAGAATAITISLATTELATIAPVTGDSLVFDDVTDNLPKKQLFSAVPLSIFNNDLGAGTQDLASVTGIGATTATESTFSGGILMADSDLNRPVLEDYAVKHQAPTVSGNAVAVNLTLGNSVLIDMDPATAAVTLTLTNPPASGRYGEVNIQLVMGTPAYGITWPVTITWVGGTAPTLTTVDNNVDMVHLFTTDAGATWYGTFGPAVGPANVTSFTTGTGLIDTGTASVPNVAVDYAGTDNFIDSATNLEGTAINVLDTIVYHDATDNNVKKGLVSDLPFGVGSGDISRVNITAGVGLSGTVDTLTGDHTQTLDFDFSELTDMVASIAGTTEFILQNGAVESRKAASEINLEFFNNAVSEFVSENDTLVVADWNWVIDEDAMGSDSAVHVPTQQSVKAYVDSVAASEMTYKGGWNATTNTPNLNTLTTTATGDMYTVTAAGTTPFTTGPNVTVSIGDVMIAESAGTLNDIADWTILEQNLNTATETVAGILEVATQVETDLTTSTLDTAAITPKKLNAWVIDGGSF